ncbi:unnamed protein product [Ophioblennius macclurei]
MAAVEAVLKRCDPALLDLGSDRELDCTEAAQMVLHLTDSRRVNKVMWRQLFIWDSMMSLLEGLESYRQLTSQKCPPQPGNEARSRWKALKVESRAADEETEALLAALQDRIQQIHDRRQTLTQLAERLAAKAQQHQQLQESLHNTQNALRSCDQQLKRLEAESEAALARLTDKRRLRDRLQDAAVAVQGGVLADLLTLGQSEITLQLRPHPSSHLSTSQLQPLKLRVAWNHDDRFTLQADEGTCVLLEEQVCGRWEELSAALLEVTQYYAGEAELLCEIQALRSSFPIDWRPAQRRLVYLKTASLVCHLEVGEGYPSRGRPRLLSVQRDGRPVDTSELKTPNSEASLTEWLVFLCSTELI